MWNQLDFFADLKVMIDGCVYVFNIPIIIGGFHLSFLIILIGTITICLVGRLIWGILK